MTGGLPAGTIKALETKHGRPIADIVGTIYVLHYDEPVILYSVSNDYPTRPDYQRSGFKSKPIRHYVGWTQQRNPLQRIRKHGAGATVHVVHTERGTLNDEERMKRQGTCPVCSEVLTP